MSPSKFRHRAAAALAILSVVAILPLQFAKAQEGRGDDEEEEQVERPAQKSDKPPEPPKNIFGLEILNAHEHQTVAAVRKQLENLLERNAVVIETRATWSKLTYEIRTSMNPAEIKNGLMQMQMEENHLKAVSFNNNKFTVEVQ